MWALALPGLGEQIVFGTENDQVLVVMHVQFAHGRCFLGAANMAVGGDGGLMLAEEGGVGFGVGSGRSETITPSPSGEGSETYELVR